MFSSSFPAGVRPRVGVDLHSFDDGDPVARHHVLGLYREAVALASDFDFIVLVSQPKALLRDYPEFDRPNVKLVRMRRLPAGLRLGVQLAWHQLRHKIDLLHVQHQLPFVPLGSCACTIHHVDFEQPAPFQTQSQTRWARWICRSTITHAEQLFTVSLHARQALTRTFGVDPATIGITYNAVDTRLYHPWPEDEALCARYGLTPQSFVCAIAAHEPRHNLQTLLRAYAALPEDLRTYPLAIVGPSGSETPALQALASELGLGPWVRWLDNIDDEQDRARLLSQAHLFVDPSWAESFGLSALQAMACGVPVIASDASAIPEVTGHAGRLFPPHDASALTRAMRADLSLPPGERAHRITNGLRQAARFEWQRSARVLVDHFRQWLISAPLGL